MAKRRRDTDEAHPAPSPPKRAHGLPLSVRVTSDWFSGARVVELPTSNPVLDQLLLANAPVVALTDNVLSPFVGLTADPSLAAVVEDGRAWVTNAAPEVLHARLLAGSGGAGSSHPILGLLEPLFGTVASVGMRAELQAAPPSALLPVLARAFGVSEACMELALAYVRPDVDFVAAAATFLNERMASFTEDGEPWFVLYGDLVSGEGREEVSGVCCGPHLRYIIQHVYGNELGLLMTRSRRGKTALGQWMGDARVRRHFAGGVSVGAKTDDDTVLTIPVGAGRAEGLLSPVFDAAVADKVGRVAQERGPVVVMGYERTIGELHARVLAGLRDALGGRLHVWGAQTPKLPPSLCLVRVHPPSTPIKTLVERTVGPPHTWHVFVLPLMDLGTVAAAVRPALAASDTVILSEADGWSTNLADTARVLSLSDAARALGALLVRSPVGEWADGEVMDAPALAAMIKHKKPMAAFSVFLRYAGAAVACPLTPSVCLPSLATARAAFAAAAGLTCCPSDAGSKLVL